MFLSVYNCMHTDTLCHVRAVLSFCHCCASRVYAYRRLCLACVRRLVVWLLYNRCVDRYAPRTVYISEIACVWVFACLVAILLSSQMLHTNFECAQFLSHTLFTQFIAFFESKWIIIFFFFCNKIDAIWVRPKLAFIYSFISILFAWNSCNEFDWIKSIK